MEKLKELFNTQKDLFNSQEGLFKSQDSKYFIFTAFKLTVVPIIAFTFVFYSLWTVIEMNYNFFVANGFASGDMFKEAFIDKILSNITEYFWYFLFTVSGVYMFGLGIAYFALRPFKEIENFAIESLEEPDLEFELDQIKSKKIIYQGAKLLFDYLYLVRNQIKGEKIQIPKSLSKMKKPTMDKVFMMQYFLLITIVCIVTSMLLFTFTNDIYEEIVKAGLTLLNGSKIVATFMQQQDAILNTIFGLAMTLNIALYFFLSRNIIKSVDGVSYAFTRDIVAIIKGEKDKRIFPRFGDPGKDAAYAINDYLNLVLGEPKAKKSLPVNEDAPNVVEMFGQEIPAAHWGELPPSFIEQSQTPNGEGVYSIITPKGYKVENLGEEQVLQLINDIETYKKSA
jgi:hypothetical protein